MQSTTLGGIYILYIPIIILWLLETLLNQCNSVKYTERLVIEKLAENCVTLILFLRFCLVMSTQFDWFLKHDETKQMRLHLHTHTHKHTNTHTHTHSLTAVMDSRRVPKVFPEAVMVTLEMGLSVSMMFGLAHPPSLPSMSLLFASTSPLPSPFKHPTLYIPQKTNV